MHEVGRLALNCQLSASCAADKEVRRIACESQAEAERVANIYNDVIANWYD